MRRTYRDRNDYRDSQSRPGTFRAEVCYRPLEMLEYGELRAIRCKQECLYLYEPYRGHFQEHQSGLRTRLPLWRMLVKTPKTFKLPVAYRPPHSQHDASQIQHEQAQQGRSPQHPSATNSFRKPSHRHLKINCKNAKKHRIDAVPSMVSFPTRSANSSSFVRSCIHSQTLKQ